MSGPVPRRKLLLVALALIVLALIKAGVAWYWWHNRTDTVAAVELRCPDLAQACALGDSGATLTFVSPPQHSAPFVVEIAGADATPTAGFDMVGMSMGVARYRFVPAGDGRWRARITLPVCVTGSSDWIGSFVVDGHEYRLPFTVGR
ncbi:MULTISPECIES: hypothetical protein [Microvirgula]|uniref:Uncharacterized protein n=1 Tax=Microvirgula aerodenitrificans TaxID=57480 RepID=A0A2S0P739_9NEIS|nr:MULTISPECIES: hypothetical protein [Microvirgula]AVY93198.1 hypothetical protein DAI18_03455 [Microvirgula aerodenitrificans]RAS19693.1 hypothetical protein DFO50_10173 [Microvirgula sp. AG722]